jgi:signal transduction histidine kinase
MRPEQPQPIPLELPSPRSRARFYPWWGLVLGLLGGAFVGHPISMLVQNIQDYVGGQASLAPLTVLYHSFHFSHMWPMTILYALAGGLFCTFLGYALKRLKEQSLLLAMLHHEFELQVATLRHHYKNLAIGIRGFSQRIKHKVAKLEECLSQCSARDCPVCGEFREDVTALTHNVDILNDTAQRLTTTLGQELVFLKALTTENLPPESRDLYPLVKGAVLDLTSLRFRDKEVQVEINGRPWNECRDTLVFPFEPYAMEIILQNLLSNAMRYGDRVGVEVQEKGSWVQVAVHDNGPGFAAENFKDHLLALADRRETDSTHLGLKVSLHLVEKSGGRLAVWSEPGAGATFFLAFPKHPRTASP